MIAKMRNMGEGVHALPTASTSTAGVYDDFVQRFAAAMAKLKVGNGLADGVAVGPLVNASSRDKVESLVDDARARGARVVLGGRRLPAPGYFYRADRARGRARRRGVPRRGDLRAGGAAAVIPDRGRRQSRARTIRSTGSSPTSTRAICARGLKVTEKLEFGMVGLNRGLVSDPAAPFGGVKQSGLGREGAHEGLMEFLETQYVSVAW